MDQIDRINLKTNDAEAEVLLAGGCLANYRLVSGDGGFDLLRPCGGRRDGTFSPLETASFPLIPYSNRIRDGSFRFAEQAYQLPLNFGDHPHSIHGVAWQASWRAVEITAEKAVIELDYRSGDWPFSFRAIQSFELTGAVQDRLQLRIGIDVLVQLHEMARPLWSTLSGVVRRQLMTVS